MHVYLSKSCPICGQAIMVTGHGYECPHCGLKIPQYIENRYISPSEAENILSGKQIILDGFSNRHKEVYSAIPVIRGKKVVLTTKVGDCPFGHNGAILVGTHKFYCNAHSYCPVSCHFLLRRSYNGHRLSVEEVRKLLNSGQLTFKGFDNKNQLTSQLLVNNTDNYCPLLISAR